MTAGFGLNLNDRSGLDTEGDRFLLLKILYAISKYHSPAVAISAGLWYNINEESAVWQTVSTFPVDQQKMIARLVAGRSFFVIKDFPGDVKNSEAHRCKQRKQS